jgi:hypothetical protein
MTKIIQNILTFRILRYLIIFIFASFLYNYISYAIRRRLEVRDFSGVIKVLQFEIEVSYIFIMVFTLVSSGLYRYLSLQDRIDNIIFKKTL